jgi:hypothetical protein
MPSPRRARCRRKRHGFISCRFKAVGIGGLVFGGAWHVAMFSVLFGPLVLACFYPHWPNLNFAVA